jgi:hypothetical protein
MLRSAHERRSRANGRGRPPSPPLSSRASAGRVVDCRGRASGAQARSAHRAERACPGASSSRRQGKGWVDHEPRGTSLSCANRRCRCDGQPEPARCIAAVTPRRVTRADEPSTPASRSTLTLHRDAPVPAEGGRLCRPGSGARLHTAAAAGPSARGFARSLPLASPPQHCLDPPISLAGCTQARPIGPLRWTQMLATKPASPTTGPRGGGGPTPVLSAPSAPGGGPSGRIRRPTSPFDCEFMPRHTAISGYTIGH